MLECAHVNTNLFRIFGGDILTVVTQFLFLILCVFSMFLIVRGDKKLKLLGYITIILIFSYICSIRPMDSADTTEYLNYYTRSANIGQLKYGLGRDYFPWIENWYINFCWACNKVGLSFSQFLFLMAFLFNSISVYSINKIVKIKFQEYVNASIVLVGLFIYFTNFGFLYSYVVIRGGLSFALFLLVYSLYLEKKYVRAIAVFFIALAFHNFSVVIIPIILLDKIRFKNKHKSLFGVLFVVLLLLSLVRFDIYFTNLFGNLFRTITQGYSASTTYLLDSNTTGGIKKGILLYLIQNIYLLYLYRDEETNTTYEFLLLSIGSIIAVLINDNAVVRATNYFFVFQLFLYVRYLMKYKLVHGLFGTKMSKDLFMKSVLIVFIIPALTMIYILRYCGIL